MNFNVLIACFIQRQSRLIDVNLIDACLVVCGVTQITKVNKDTHWVTIHIHGLAHIVEKVLLAALYYLVLKLAEPFGYFDWTSLSYR